MWIVAGVLLGLVVFSSIFGFHFGPHAHAVAAVAGIAAAGFLIAIAVSGDTRSLVFSPSERRRRGVGGSRGDRLEGPHRPEAAAGRSLHSLVSREGVAVSDLEPAGIVRVAGENWSATSLNGRIPAGARIQVIQADGVRLSVWGDNGLPRETDGQPALDERSPSVDAARPIEGTEQVVILGIVIAVAVVLVIAVAQIGEDHPRVPADRAVPSRPGDRPARSGHRLHQPGHRPHDARRSARAVPRDPHQTAITKDNAPISIDFIIFYKVVDPSMSVLTVQNFAGAALNLAATTLRSVVGDMPLDDVLSKREDMNASLRVRLDDVTERWGVKVTSVEVREVNPPPGVLEAMTRQMSAERTRRAQVTEAEGQKSAAILSAEGEAQAAINLAEGRQKATILAAEADRQSAILRAEGYARGLEKVFVVAQTLDQKTMVLQYLDTLKQVGTSASTKIVVPMEILDGLRSLLPGGEPPPAGTRRAARADPRPPVLSAADEVARRELVLGPVEQAGRRLDGEAVRHPRDVLDGGAPRLGCLRAEFGAPVPRAGAPERARTPRPTPRAGGAPVVPAPRSPVAGRSARSSRHGTTPGPRRIRSSCPPAPVLSTASITPEMNVEIWAARVDPQRCATSRGISSGLTIPAATASSKSWQT